MPYDVKAAAALSYTERKEPELVKLDKKGDRFAGVLVGLQKQNMKEGPALKALFEMPNGEIKAMFLSAQLKQRISSRDVGHYVQIQCEGFDQSVGLDKGNAMKLFRVVVSDSKVPGVDPLEITDADIPF
ncbi:MAG TPA: hypothetical protein VMU24_02390 [Candidatus Acidoferrales bacterium]|nr:hypothetical protein [Candidatus Acidoferrales bacterium]